MRVLFFLSVLTQCFGTSTTFLRGNDNGCTMLGCDVPEKTKNEIAKILEGILGRLQGSSHSHRRELGMTEIKSPLLLLRSKLKDDKSDAFKLVYKELGKSCPFGYGCSQGRPMDAATKAKVAQILGGILSNLEGKK